MAPARDPHLPFSGKDGCVPSTQESVATDTTEPTPVFSCGRNDDPNITSSGKKGKRRRSPRLEPPSPSAYRSRSNKQARQPCCNCSSTGHCLEEADCECRKAGRLCLDCDQRVEGCCNRAGHICAPRPRPISTKLASIREKNRLSALWEKADLLQATPSSTASATLAASTPGKHDDLTTSPPQNNPITPSPATLKASSSSTSPGGLSVGNTAEGSESATVTAETSETLTQQPTPTETVATVVEVDDTADSNSVPADIPTQPTDSESSRANSVSAGGEGDSNGNVEEVEVEDVEE